MIYKALLYGLFISAIFMILNSPSDAEPRLYPTSPNTWATQDRTTEIDPAVAKELHDLHVENEKIKRQLEFMPIVPLDQGTYDYRCKNSKCY